MHLQTNPDDLPAHFQSLDPARQIIAHTRSDGKPGKAGINRISLFLLKPAQYFLPVFFQDTGNLEQTQSVCRQLRPTPADTADTFFHKRDSRQIGQGIDRLPGRLVTDPGLTGCL